MRHVLMCFTLLLLVCSGGLCQHLTMTRHIVIIILFLTFIKIFFFFHCSCTSSLISNIPGWLVLFIQSAVNESFLNFSAVTTEPAFLLITLATTKLEKNVCFWKESAVGARWVFSLCVHTKKEKKEMICKHACITCILLDTDWLVSDGHYAFWFSLKCFYIYGFVRNSVSF